MSRYFLFACTIGAAGEATAPGRPAAPVLICPEDRGRMGGVPAHCMGEVVLLL